MNKMAASKDKFLSDIRYMGKRIFEEEQQGKDCADYGAYLIKNLAKQLEPEYGSGFSIRQLQSPILQTLSNCDRIADTIKQVRYFADKVCLSPNSAVF